MNFLPLIEAKRDGQALTAEQLKSFTTAVTTGQIPDYQIAAFLMAIYFRGLDPAETAALTIGMRDSGEVLAFPTDTRPLVDKHSTGGIGDKVSLPLAPLLACLGFRVPMVSGRGLGITGGTLDKLDSIPGFNTTLSTDRIVEIVQSVGCVICGQTARMVPADKMLYALRDVTATVPSIPLIVASILSKKLAEGLDALVLDVKFGAAAFMPTQEKARELAKAMVGLGNDCGVNTRALLTDMNSPLGRAAGNWLEVKEAVACLNSVPSESDHSHHLLADLRELVLSCAAQLLVQTRKAGTIEAARAEAEQSLASGKPRQKWDEMIVAQGADLDAFNRKLSLDHTAPIVAEVKSTQDGYFSRCDARLIGEVIRDLGGGRMTREATLNYDVGVELAARPGDFVKAGSVLARVHAATPGHAEAAHHRIKEAFQISPEPPRLPPLINGIILSGKKDGK